MLKKLRNLTWLSAEPLFRLVSGLVTLLVVAPLLGPEAFGTFSYILALIAIFQAFGRFGQEGTIMRRIGQEPDAAVHVFANSMLVSLAASIVAAGCCVGFLVFGWQGSQPIIATASFVALAVLFTPGEVALGVLKAKEAVSRAVALRLIVAILVLGGVLFLVMMDAGVTQFVALRSLESVVGAAILLVLAFSLVLREGRPHISFKQIKSLLADGLPLLANGLLGIAILRIDQLMIGPLAGADELGQYAVAARVAEVGNFLPAALYGALYAAAARNLATQERFAAYFQRFFDLFTVSGFVVAGGLAIGTWLFLSVLLGEDYAGAVPMTLILLLSTPLFFANMAFTMLRNLRGWLWSGVVLSCGALLVNIAANWWLIPSMGGKGAAIATILSLGVVGLGGALVLPQTRSAGWAMIRAFNPFGAAYRLWHIYAPLMAARSHNGQDE